MISKLRQEIDKIDSKILNLLNKRAEIVLKVSKTKQKYGYQIYSPERERKIILNLLEKSKGILPKEDIASIFSEIIQSCRSLSRRLRVAYLGPEATFTHSAAIKIFGKKTEYIPLKTISDVFYEVEKDRADYGVVPIENSTEGVINHTLDMFMESDLKICGELNIPIHHHLLSNEKKFENIKVIYSHPQALSQCRNWLESNLPSAKVIETSSTSEAAKMVKNKRYAAAIASSLAAKLYGLKILVRRIEDTRENYTRFLIVGKNMPKKSGQDKTSIMFSIKDRVGALHDMLKPFKQNNINLTMIESRPVKEKPWQYVFFLDFVGHKDEKHVENALNKLQKMAVFVKVLGSYPKSE